ncbi:hypothetical protein SLS62_007384 [Diatrype stigma]|uniref:Uncharacterized protein n=1 Tax=Diatrype stigma TaxID=117547 RepID=A0AAN9ULE2_9PEZI
MADDTSTPASAAYATGRRPTSPTAAGHAPAPPGFGVRRAVTIDPGAQQMRRRRPTLDTSPSGGGGVGGSEGGLLAGIRRGSSSFSDYSINDATKDLGASAEDLFNIHPSGSAGSPSNARQASHYLPIVFALLPALAGIFFENGASFFTDLILLSLAAVVLHWSVTQPWDWYLETQQVRVVSSDDDDDDDDELVSPQVLETDSDLEPAGSPSATAAPKRLGEIAENGELAGEEPPDKSVANGKETQPAQTQSKERPRHRTTASARWEARRTAAAKELRIHEVLALAWCFAFPVLGSYLLHTIRSQLSRPSEGLVSDYNLTIFLCAAELRPVSHLIKMVRGRTLRMQRVVSANPYDPNPAAAAAVSAEALAALSSRLDDLEARAATAASDKGEEGGLSAAASSRMNQAARVQEISSTMQPEMDAMNRAMRRYEKKLAVLAGQMDGRLEYIDRRLQDAVALAAVAAKNSSSSSSSSRGTGLFAWLLQWIAAALLLPVHAVVAVFTFPFRTASALLRGSSSSKSKHPPEKARSRTTRDRGWGAENAGHGGTRDAPDRIPSRLSRR